MENFKSKSANRLFIKTLAVAFLKRIENLALLKPASNCRRQVSPTETPRILIGHLIIEKNSFLLSDVLITSSSSGNSKVRNTVNYLEAVIFLLDAN